MSKTLKKEKKKDIKGKDELLLVSLTEFYDIEKNKMELMDILEGKNKISLGVCLIGQNNFTKQQYDSLEKILNKWKVTYPDAKIIGHRDSTITDKSCPNFDVISWCKERNIP